MKFSELKRHLAEACKRGIYEPVYIVAGDDAYLCEKAVGAITALADPENAEFNVTSLRYDGSIKDTLEALYTYPLFGDLRIVVLDSSADKLTDEDKISFSEYLDSPTPSSVLAVVDSGGAFKPFHKSQGVITVDCSKPDRGTIRELAEEILQIPPARAIGSDAMSELISRTTGDMSKIACELEKLKAYSEGAIGLGDVKELVAPDTEFQIYELSDAVSSRNTAKSLKVLEGFSKQGIRPNTVLSLLYTHYRRMLHTELHKTEPDAELAALLGIKSGALYHLKRASSNYSQVRLKKCVDYLHELQYAVLCGKRSEAGALNEAVLTLLNI